MVSRTVTNCCSRIGRSSKTSSSINHKFYLRSTNNNITTNKIINDDKSIRARMINHSLNYATQASPLPKSTQPIQSGDLKPVGSDSKSEKFSPKIEELVKTISQLNLLEAADLVKALKSRLNITEVAMPVQAVAPPSAQSKPNESSESSKSESAEAEKPKEKTAFTLTLTQIDATQKAKVIKEVKTVMPNMNLVEAKKFVESLPKVLKENGTKEEVEKLKKSLESVGATVKLE